MSIKKSKIQKNFKKQIKEIEKVMVKKEKRDEGVLSNKLFKLRFYGYWDKPKSERSSVLLKLAIALFKGVAAFVVFLLCIMGLGVVFFVLVNFFILNEK